MVWKIGSAKQRFSEVLRLAAEQPQIIHNRDAVVGAVLGPEDTTAFLAWRERKSDRIAEALREARQICAEERYVLPLKRGVDPRVDRENPVLKVADARGHHRDR